MSTKSRGRLLVGGLLFSSALTACVSQSSYDAVEAENTQLKQQAADQAALHAAQRSSDQATIAEHKGQISRLQGAIKYSIESDLLFAPGSWELTDAGKQSISKMAHKLAPTQRNKLVVTGYTDNTPIGQSLEKKGVTSNQELSEKRAEAVRDYLVSQGLDPNLVSAVGEGAAKPVAKNDTAKGRSQNRRVELSLGG